jgi:hypothetical protein
MDDTAVMQRDADRTPTDPPPGNPFATRRVRPGAIPYFFPHAVDAQTLVARLEQNGWHGEIVGPHGSGKSTLLAALVDAVERRGKSVVVYRLREGERYLPETPCSFAAVPKGAVVAVDGFEQLGWLRKKAMRWLCRVRGLGLLVTAHAAVGLPLLWRTVVDRTTVERVVAHLLESEPQAGAVISSDDVARAVDAHPTNAREALFGLYDVYERRREKP